MNGINYVNYKTHELQSSDEDVKDQESAVRSAEHNMNVHKGEKMSLTPVFHIRCILSGIEPPIWRSLHVPIWMTLHQLYVALTLIFSLEEEETYSFDVNGTIIGLTEPVPFQSDHIRLEHFFLPGLRISCRFPSGWEVTVQAAGLAEKEAGKTYPRVLAGERASPLSSLSGPQAYRHMLKNLKQNPLWQAERLSLMSLQDLFREKKEKFRKVTNIGRGRKEIGQIGIQDMLMTEADVLFDMHAYQHELETALWEEPKPKTLKEALKNLSMEELLGLSMVYGLFVEDEIDESSLRTTMESMLPTAIRLQIPFMDDRQAVLLRSAVSQADGVVALANMDVPFSAYELYYFHDRLLLYPDRRKDAPYLYMLKEVREAMDIDNLSSLVRTQTQNANRRRIIAGMFQYYGVMTMDQLQEVLSETLGEAVAMDNLVVDIQELQDFSDVVTIGDLLVMHTSLDMERAMNIWVQQQLYEEFSYKIISLETLDLAGDWMFVDVTPEAEVLVAFLSNRYGYNLSQAEGTVWEFMHRYRFSEPFSVSEALARQTLKHPDTAAEKRLVALMFDLYRHAPSWQYKGWSPSEADEMMEATLAGSQKNQIQAKSNADVRQTDVVSEINSLLDSNEPAEIKILTDGTGSRKAQHSNNPHTKPVQQSKVLAFPGAPRKPKNHEH